MKNILLATDFSSNAHIAAICAAELAARLNGRLIIFHALPPVAQLTEEEASDKASLEEVTQKKLDALAHELHQKFGLSVSRLLKPGFAAAEIPAIAQCLKAELVVLGAQGENSLADKVLGSISTSLLENSKLPVVCVPADALLNFTHQLALILNKEQPLCNSLGSGLLMALNS